MTFIMTSIKTFIMTSIMTVIMPYRCDGRRGSGAARCAALMAPSGSFSGSSFCREAFSGSIFDSLSWSLSDRISGSRSRILSATLYASMSNLHTWTTLLCNV